MAKVRLYCLPHAGGAASVYLSWRRILGEEIDLQPIELSGRGKRNDEPLYTSMEQAVDDVYATISAGLHEMPYAILGHSMGSIIAYELVRKIKSHAKTEPVHMFFSGRFAPFLKKSDFQFHTLPDQEFIEKFAEIGGLSADVLKNQDVMNYLLPIFRSDCKIVETYNHQQPIVKMNCDITVLSGNQDTTILLQDVDSWKNCALKKCNFYTFNEGHFFLHKFKEEVTNLICSTMKLTIESPI